MALPSPGSWPPSSASVPGAEAQTRLDAIPEPYLATYGLPALGAAVVKDGKIIAAGAFLAWPR
jgi:hypothetical protein